MKTVKVNGLKADSCRISPISLQLCNGAYYQQHVRTFSQQNFNEITESLLLSRDFIKHQLVIILISMSFARIPDTKQKKLNKINILLLSKMIMRNEM